MTLSYSLAAYNHSKDPTYLSVMSLYPHKKGSVVELSIQLSFKTDQHFVVSQTFRQCLMFLPGFLTPIQKVHRTKLFHTFLLKSTEVQGLDIG